MIGFNIKPSGESETFYRVDIQNLTVSDKKVQDDILTISGKNVKLIIGAYSLNSKIPNDEENLNRLSYGETTVPRPKMLPIESRTIKSSEDGAIIQRIFLGTDTHYEPGDYSYDRGANLLIEFEENTYLLISDKIRMFKSLAPIVKFVAPIKGDGVYPYAIDQLGNYYDLSSELPYEPSKIHSLRRSKEEYGIIVPIPKNVKPNQEFEWASRNIYRQPEWIESSFPFKSQTINMVQGKRLDDHTYILLQMDILM